MTSRELTIAFELAIAVFALYLLIRRLARLGASDQRIPPFYVQEPPDDPSRNPDELVTIAWFKLGEEAEMWAENLRSVGILATVIDATVQGERYIGLRGSISPQLQVRFTDAHQAAEILREAEKNESRTNDEPPAET